MVSSSYFTLNGKYPSRTRLIFNAKFLKCKIHENLGAILTMDVYQTLIHQLQYVYLFVIGCMLEYFISKYDSVIYSEYKKMKNLSSSSILAFFTLVLILYGGFISSNFNFATLGLSGLLVLINYEYARLTQKLVSETSKMREVQTEPNVYVFIELKSQYNEIVQMFIQNIGMGIAKNIKITVPEDFIYYRDEKQSRNYLLAERSLIDKGIAYLAPNQKMEVFSASTSEIKELNSTDLLNITIDYTNNENEPRKAEYPIEFSTIPEVTWRIKNTPLDHLDMSIKAIEEDIKAMSSSFKTFAKTSKLRDDKAAANLLLNSITDENEYIKEFKNLVKSRVLFGFYEYWKIFSQTVGTNYSPDADNILREYYQLYLQVIIQGSEILPDDLEEKLEQFATRMILKTKQMKVGTFSDAYMDVNTLAEEVYDIYKNFDNYQFKVNL